MSFLDKIIEKNTLKKEYDALKKHLGEILLEHNAKEENPQDWAYYSRKFEESRKKVQDKKISSRPDSKTVNEGRFDNVDLGAKSMNQRIMSVRRNLANSLEELIESKELDPNMTLGQTIAFLRG
jgi:hypothetical protein